MSKHTDALKADAQARYARSMDKVATTPEPRGQKFPVGSRVRIADNCLNHLGECMFPSGVNATVEYTYAHAYGGNLNVKSYSLMIDGYGSSAWYEEWQLTAIETS